MINEKDIKITQNSESASSGWLVCDDCKRKRYDVVETICPYAKELYNKDVDCILCDECYHERCMDI